MEQKKCVILKVTGKLFSAEQSKTLNDIIRQLSLIYRSMCIGIVPGGGNIFRGDEQSSLRGIRSAAGHTMGMLSTMINGVMLHDLLDQANIPSCIMTGLDCPSIGTQPRYDSCKEAFDKEKIIIFAGGTGLPFVTTDTNALIRALQIGAYQVWKATSIDGIYTDDPLKNHLAKKLTTVSYEEAKNLQLAFIDPVARVLAEKHSIPVRMFSIFEPNALVRLAENEPVGSILT